MTEGTRSSLERWLGDPMVFGHEYLWRGRIHDPFHISTHPSACFVRDWVSSIGLDPNANGAHSMRRTRVAKICKKNGNLRAVQLLLGNTKMDSTIRYFGVELKDALEIAEGVEI